MSVCPLQVVATNKQQLQAGTDASRPAGGPRCGQATPAPTGGPAPGGALLGAAAPGKAGGRPSGGLLADLPSSGLLVWARSTIPACGAPPTVPLTAFLKYFPGNEDPRNLINPDSHN